jgi:hypothetical protein
MLTTFQITLFAILGVLIIIYTILKIRDYFRGKIAQETKLQLLKPDVKYEIVYSVGFFGTRKIYAIIPKVEHRTILTETRYYNGKTNMSITVSTNNMTVYSAFLKDVRALYSSEEDKNQ